MGDMAPRPRGGWQVGQRILGRNKQSGLYGDGWTDPAPDVYAVERTSNGFTVRHFQAMDDARMCCRPVIVRRRKDEDDITALARAYRLIEQQHAPRSEAIA